MTLTDKLTIAAILIGPIVAVVLSLWIQRAAQKRQQRLAVLYQLLSNRHQVLSENSVQALNVIDLVFSGRRHRKVRGALGAFVDSLKTEGVPPEERMKKYNSLLLEASKSLGYGREFTYLDADRVLYPNLPQPPVIDPKAQELQEELLRVLKNSEALGYVKEQEEPE